MKIKATSLNEKKGHLAVSVIKGSLIALCISLIGILLFAFLLKFTNISDGLIVPINQVIKGISIFLGVFIGLKNEKKMGLVGGFLVGLIYTIIAFLSFSILDGSFSFDKTLLNDVIFGSIIGGICGIISINIKKSSN